MSNYRPKQTSATHARFTRWLTVIALMPLLHGCQWMEETDWMPDHLIPNSWSLSDDAVQQDPVERARQKMIARLMEKGDLAFAKDRLNSPANDNAVMYYREVLKISPQNEDAIKGLTRVSKRYRKLARTAHDNGNTSQAKKYIAQAESVTGVNDPSNIKLRRKLQQTPAGQDQRALDQSLQQEIKARKQQLEQHPAAKDKTGN